MKHLNILALGFTLAFAAALASAKQPTTRPSGIKQDAPASTNRTATTTETVVLLRHGEKPQGGKGQLSPQGLNRAIALSELLPKKFGKPDYIFAPDPHFKVTDGGGLYDYVRPLITIEPTAIKLGMPVQTSLGFGDVKGLNDELAKPKYANAMVFVAWEHWFGQKAAVEMVKRYGGDTSKVPDWPANDYDSLYVMKITRTPGSEPTITFEHDHENLDGLSTSMPVPAAK